MKAYLYVLVAAITTIASLPVAAEKHPSYSVSCQLSPVTTLGGSSSPVPGTPLVDGEHTLAFAKGKKGKRELTACPVDVVLQSRRSSVIPVVSQPVFHGHF